MAAVDPELNAAAARLGQDAARARLCLAAGGTREEAEVIMRGGEVTPDQPPTSPG
ncbi:hypothetical protein [Streptosporangium saharense]|uniref:hypothetical protein n=1 Tax=Streptosporangium saharense TaxID=1706840 RepID=UPI00341590D4